MSIVKRNQRKTHASIIGVDLASGPDQSVTVAVKKGKIVEAESSRAEGIMDEFDFFKAAMDSDLAQLKKFSHIEDKLEYKAKAIENHQYLDYLRRYQTEGTDHQNMVLAWVVIWLVDLGHWKTAFEFLPLLVTQNQRLPGRFSTQDWPTFLIDQLYDEGAKHLSQGRDAVERSHVIQLFTQFIHLLNTHQWRLSELIGGKLYAMAAKLEQSVFNLGNAYTYGTKATALNDKAGVKKMVREIAKTIGKDNDL